MNSPLRLRRRHAEDESPAHSTAPPRVAIFITVGTELPFDRLVRAVDEWAGRTGRGHEVFAQIGVTSYRPEFIGWAPMIEGRDFRQLFDGADLIVAHAGMGTILSALENSRPLIVVPRRAMFGEHRNDHQLATVQRLGEQDLVEVAQDECELVKLLDEGVHVEAKRQLGPYADEQLIAAVRHGVVEPRGA